MRLHDQTSSTEAAADEMMTNVFLIADYMISSSSPSEPDCELLEWSLQKLRQAVALKLMSRLVGR